LKFPQINQAPSHAITNGSFLKLGNQIEATAALTSRKYRLLSAVNIIRFVRDKTSHIVLRDSSIIVLNVPSPTEGKCDDSEGSI